MKKFTTGIMAALLVVCFSAVGFAGYHGFGNDRGSGRGYGPRHNGYDYDRPAMTEQQKQECLDFMNEKNKLRAEFLNSEAKAGRMSKAEADASITLMNEHFKRMKDSNFERPAISEEARTARIQYHDKMRNLEVQHIKKGIASGTIEQERGNRMIERLENRDDYRGYHGEGYHGGGRHHGGGPRHWR